MSSILCVVDLSGKKGECAVNIDRVGLLDYKMTNDVLQDQILNRAARNGMNSASTEFLLSQFSDNGGVQQNLKFGRPSR